VGQIVVGTCESEVEYMLLDRPGSSPPKDDAAVRGRRVSPRCDLHVCERGLYQTRLVLSGQMPSPSLGVQRREREYIPLFLLLHQLKCMGSSLRLYMYSCLVISHCEIMVKQLGMHITLKLEFSGILGDSWMR